MLTLYHCNTSTLRQQIKAINSIDNCKLIIEQIDAWLPSTFVSFFAPCMSDEHNVFVRIIRSIKSDLQDQINTRTTMNHTPSRP